MPSSLDLMTIVLPKDFSTNKNKKSKDRLCRSQSLDILEIRFGKRNFSERMSASPLFVYFHLSLSRDEGLTFIGVLNLT